MDLLPVFIKLVGWFAIVVGVIEYNSNSNKKSGVESCLLSTGSQVADSDTAISDGQLRNKRTPVRRISSPEPAVAISEGEDGVLCEFRWWQMAEDRSFCR